MPYRARSDCDKWESESFASLWEHRETPLTTTKISYSAVSNKMTWRLPIQTSTQLPEPPSSPVERPSSIVLSSHREARNKLQRSLIEGVNNTPRESRARSHTEAQSMVRTESSYNPPLTISKKRTIQSPPNDPLVVVMDYRVRFDKCRLYDWRSETRLGSISLAKLIQELLMAGGKVGATVRSKSSWIYLERWNWRIHPCQTARYHERAGVWWKTGIYDGNLRSMWHAWR